MAVAVCLPAAPSRPVKIIFKNIAPSLHVSDIQIKLTILRNIEPKGLKFRRKEGDIGTIQANGASNIGLKRPKMA